MAQGPLPQLGLSQAGQEIGPVVAHEQQPWCDKDMTMASPGMMQKNPCRSGKKKKCPSGEQFFWSFQMAGGYIKSSILFVQVLFVYPGNNLWLDSILTRNAIAGQQPKGTQAANVQLRCFPGNFETDRLSADTGLTSLVAEANVPFRSLGPRKGTR